MNIGNSFYNAWTNTKHKALQIFSTHSYFPKHAEKEIYLNSLSLINEWINNTFDSIFRINYQPSISPAVASECFDSLNQGFLNLKNELIEQYGDRNWIDFHISILNNIQPYLLDNFSKQFNLDPGNKKHFEKFNALCSSYILWFSQKNKPESEETFRELTEINIEKMLNEFNLASIHLMDNLSWYQNFLQIQQVYNAIKQSHKRIGLPTENLGVNKKLNVVISNTFLNDRKWMGFQSKTNASFSIFINPSPYGLKETWIHEYTHFLDRLAAHVYYQEHKTDEEISSFSHIALNLVVNEQPIHNNPLRIMAETMSAIIGGVPSDEFAKKIKNTINTTREHISLKILSETLPEKEKTWDSLSVTEKQVLLFQSKVVELTRFIMLEVSNHPHGTFGLNNNDVVVSIEGNKVTRSNLFVPDIITSIYEKNKELNPYLMHSNLIEYLNENLANDVRFIMNYHNLYIYKDHSVYSDRFFLSIGNDATKNAQQLQNADKEVLFSYYDKPLELLARMVESLQSPLLNNYEYKNLELKSKSDFISPILGKEERMMVCVAVQSMASYVGIEIEETNLEHLPCVIPNNIDENFNLQILDPADYVYAKPNQVIPNEASRKIILQNIEKLKEKHQETAKSFFKRKE